ncbi:MAG: FAD/NAD(P)-binding oxidoreductase [Nostoc sp.]|uniref:NAD(P)/FAD-dependent oxidoreductase n=1 Tax=Nostoc sp. TaxID=1180 RepID=UPI002FF28F32
MSSALVKPLDHESVIPNDAKSMQYQIVIVGGGAAGITVAAQLLKKNKQLDVAIIEPRDKHYYQPAWTLVGGGVYKALDTVKDEKDYIPERATWIKDYVAQLDPDNNTVITQEGKRICYEYLILAPGIQIDWHLIKGLKETIGQNGVCSNYAYEYAPYTWEVIKNFKDGNAIFTYPNTPVKCGGAPLKITYLADDAFRRQGIRPQSKIMFCTAMGVIFGVKEFAKTLLSVVERKQIDVRYKHNLKEIKADTKTAIFEVLTDSGVEEVTIQYDLLHVTPPMSAPDFIKQSKLAAPDGASLGFVNVNKHTLQHNVYPNVFSLGDAANLPTSKTAAAVRKQAPVVVHNLLALINSKNLTQKYNGYSCCPITTGYGKVVLAEVSYDNKLSPTFPIDPTRERYSMWLLKKYGFPYIYWNRMLKGKPFEGKLLGIGS